MASVRLFTGDDGQSHIEEIDPASHPDWTQLHGAQGIVFRASPRGTSAIGIWRPGGNTSSPCPGKRKSGLPTERSIGSDPEMLTSLKT